MSYVGVFDRCGCSSVCARVYRYGSVFVVSGVSAGKWGYVY